MAERSLTERIMVKLHLSEEQVTATWIKRCMMARGFGWIEMRLTESHVRILFTNPAVGTFIWKNSSKCTDMDAYLETVIQAALNVLP